ncbi:MAG: metal-dependent transcriptional regulator [archaeon]|nr:metal-dependent transcriptional regulator [Candidatus Bathyarchaeum sp.]
MNSKQVAVTNQAEEYLEAIYRLENKAGFARTMELSRKLGVVPGSITNTVENLERKQLVIREPYKGVKLTPSGRKIASSILRRHRLAERLLTDFLQIDWSEVHDPACSLEHALTPEILKPLEKALGHPKRCPHGNPIPTDCGRIQEDETVALTELDAQTTGNIIKITEEKPEILRELVKLKLVPGTQLKIVKNTGKAEQMEIKVAEKSCTIDHDLASIIYVKKIQEGSN